jgi:hypothetical protein
MTSGLERQAVGGVLSCSSGRFRGAADAIRLGILSAAGACLAVGELAVGMKGIAVLAPTLIARQVGLAPAYDFAFALALGGDLLGTGFGLYDLRWWDTVAHFVLPLLSAPVAYAALVRIGACSPLPAIRAGFASFVSVLVLGVAWELVEALADLTAGTNFAPSASDTAGDLVTDLIAAGCGATFVGLAVRTHRPALWTWASPMRASAVDLGERA